MVSPTDPVLDVQIHRAGDRLCWRVANASAAPVWAFLLVPSIIAGRESFAVDAAWFAAEGARVIARKVDTPVPDDGRRIDRVTSGAIELAPGAVREGALVLGDQVEVGGPYEDELVQRPVGEIVLEVGWLPVREGQRAERLQWDGAPFAYLEPEIEPGGQRFTRSAPLRWG